MRKPIIGILTSTMYTSSERFNESNRIFVNYSYINAIIKNGGVPLIIPPTNDASVLLPLLEKVDGILFPGGDDVDPSYYNEDPHPTIGEIRPEIDEYSFICAKYAFENEIPILGICRGLQLINDACGGTLYQDLKKKKKETILHVQRYRRDYLAHDIEIYKDTALYDLLDGDSARINTMHHQVIKDLGEGLKVSAVAPDGLIEAIENEDASILAVQWHPEELLEVAPNMNNIFTHFIDKAKKYHQKVNN